MKRVSMNRDRHSKNMRMESMVHKMTDFGMSTIPRFKTCSVARLQRTLRDHLVYGYPPRIVNFYTTETVADQNKGGERS
jgi:hypothetical protein